MKQLLAILLSLIVFHSSFAGKISGTITDDKGNPLPFASILVKGTARGTTANNLGKYFLNLQPGNYIIVCQYVGYKREEKKITVTEADQTLDFQLQQQELVLSEVIVKKGEDPAYEIIRQAIKKRPFYKDQLSEFSCEVYTKGQMKLRDYPQKFFRKKVDFEDGDTSKKKMIFLSETVATYAVQKPDKVKVEVLSSKVSGQSDGFGLSAPEVASFYDNNLNFGNALNPRGFISPIASNALNFYRYKYEGSFYEDGKEISHIKVIPKRKFEPLFSGYINIVEDEWRIHSVQLQLTKESQMELVDTLKIDQLYVPFENDVWVIKSQVLYAAIKIFGFDVHGNFVNVYSKFNLQPGFSSNYFGKTVLKYLDSSNKKTQEYWEQTRPLPLQEEEIADYKKKDSLEKARKDPRYLDSLDRKRNKFSVLGFIATGQSFGKQKKRSIITIPAALNMINFNTVEGWVVNFSPAYFKRLDTSIMGRKSVFFTPTIRYGFSNHHLNASLLASYNFGKSSSNTFSIAGGRKVFQLNNEAPIKPRDNTFSTLLWERNYMKIYEAEFTRIGYARTLDEGFTGSIGVEFQNRHPLENSTDFKWRNRTKIDYTPNYPVEIMSENFKAHQAFIATITLGWQPGNRYIEFPGRKISVGSKYPRFTFSYTKGFDKLLGSDIRYDKWKLVIDDNLNLKLGGRFSYHLSVGGFLNADSVNIQDYIHFTGNRLLEAAPYLRSFQLAPYYRYSNTEEFYASANVEHHFNGFLTNKIPFFKKLNWHLVNGANAFYVNEKNNYVEVFVGLENILKVIRVDFIWGYQPNQPAVTGFRIGFKGVLTGSNE